MNAPIAGPIHQAQGAACGLEIRDPTTDVRLLEYCFGVPDEMHSLDGGETHARAPGHGGSAAAGGAVNKVRGRQAADVALRLLDHRDEMEATLRGLESTPAVAVPRPPALRAAWQALQAR